MCATLVSTWYIDRVNLKNAAALIQSDELTEIVGQVRGEIWAADSALNAMLVSPHSQLEQIILSSLSQAKLHLDKLARHESVQDHYLSDQVQSLDTELARLTVTTQELISKRRDINWVYPILPFISNKLLEPNIIFSTAVDQALREITESDGRSYASDLYGRFDEANDLWQQKILNFRAVVIRFAGLRDIETTPQEANIEQLHELIEEKLQELEELKIEGRLGFESEAALDDMREASEAWQQSWETVQRLRSDNIWRADLIFMEEELRPVQELVLNALGNIEKNILKWSEQNTATVKKAANQVIYVLWGLSALALIFVAIVYILINRSVLNPIARIARALSTDNKISNYRLEDNSSQEISKLVNAFNTMSQQIHQRQMALEHQALHDGLTGLPNRVLLQDRVEQAIKVMHRNNQPMSILLLDLDRFKEVNDALGHQAGDYLLQKVGNRIESMLRETDTVARLGGDEFAIVAPNTGISHARGFAEKIASAINTAFSIQRQDVYVGASIGVATYPDHGEDTLTLIRNADVAMYVAKRNNLDVSVYEEQYDTYSVDRLTLIGDLHNELEAPRFLELYYQPLVGLVSGEVVAVEALLRWNHPLMGFIPPEEIISMAECTGLIGPLTYWVLNTAIEGSAEFQDSSSDFSISINLSAWNLQDPQLPSDIQSILDAHQYDADRLTLEITESAMMNDPVRAREVMDKLNDMGVELAIDDFGTGFSSLGYLKMLPVSCLKIDKSFVIDMLKDENDAIIVQSTINLAHNLGLKVVAEGVENQEIAVRLRHRGCDVAQGYHIARPLKKEAFLQWYETYEVDEILA